ncbi:hypothetical protein CRE_19762 [Caenorhabditis remanei]|uniref:BTB domain-containing protein n=1 Tax=Caenorhabditis remanei TaxID=31234 RepID=E3MTP1_CAERE|nr:hypothetical protein CRE_19762 [Caenorhabditis remanei]
MTTPELSKFLEPEEKESVLKAISENEKAMASGVCNVLTNNNGDWVNSKPGTAVALFLKNSVERYYRILVVEPSCEAEKVAEIQLNFRIKGIIIFTKMPAKLLVFKNDNGEDIGLQFYSTKECEQFHESISNRRSGSSQLTHSESARLKKLKTAEREQKSRSFWENMTDEQKIEIVDTMDKFEFQTPEDERFAWERLLEIKQTEEENKRKSATEATTSSLENSKSALKLNLPTADNSSKVTEMKQNAVPNFAELVPAEVDSVETSDLTEREKKMKRIGAVRIPVVPNNVRLKINNSKKNVPSVEGRPSESAHQEHVPELMPDVTSTPPVPAHRACWAVPKDPVPDNGLPFHNLKEREQLQSAANIDEQETSGISQLKRGGSVKLRESENEARKQKSQSFCEMNMPEEQKKEYQDNVVKQLLLNHKQDEEENKRKSTTEELKSSLENSQSAMKLNLLIAYNLSKITEQSVVTNLAEPVPVEVDPVETSDPTENEKVSILSYYWCKFFPKFQKRMGFVQTSGSPNIGELRDNGKKIDGTSDEGRPSELAHQEHVPEPMPDPTFEPAVSAPRACWTVPNDPAPESPLESPQLEEPEPVVETEYEKYFAETEGTDAILIVKGKKLHVNKKFLSHRSEYFSRLFISIGKDYPTELVEHEDLAILLSLLMPESFSLIGTNAETLLELADRFKLAAAKPDLEQFIIGTDMDRFEKIRIGEKHQLENLLNNGIMEFNGEDVFSQMELNPSYKTISDRVKVQILSRVLRMKK